MIFLFRLQFYSEYQKVNDKIYCIKETILIKFISNYYCLTLHDHNMNIFYGLSYNQNKRFGIIILVVFLSSA